MKKRYPEVAERIMAELRSGEIRIGTSLPSEAVLCARFGVSRSTIRSALAELQRLGLIERKQGAATRVLSAEPPPTYVHSMLAAGDLMQFAGPSHRRVHSITPIVADERLGMWLEDKPGRRWIQISQTRHIAGRAAIGTVAQHVDLPDARIALAVINALGVTRTALAAKILVAGSLAVLALVVSAGFVASPAPAIALELDPASAFGVLQGAGLLFFALGLHKPHLWALCGDNNRLGISRIILLSLHKRAHILRCDQLNFMRQLFHHARPVMGTTTGLHYYNCWGQLRHKSQKLRPRQLLAELDLPRSQGTMNLENCLCQIDPNHHILHLAVLLCAWR